MSRTGGGRADQHTAEALDAPGCRHRHPAAVTAALDRRTVLSGACLVALTPAVSACGGQEQQDAPTAGTVLGSTTEVPIAGGTVLTEHRVVVTQPIEGDFHAFSAVCTHQGCTVAEVANGTINCPCHGSRFDVNDGSVVRGPADRPLPRVDVVIDGTSITLR